MEIYKFKDPAISRLDAISEKLNAIQKEILEALEVLPERTELVEQLISRLDGVAMELNAFQVELQVSRPFRPHDAETTPHAMEDGAGLRP